LLIVTGDPPKMGPYPDATAVFDVDSIGLTNLVSRLNRGCDVGGQAIGAPTGYHIGVSFNPAAPNADEELRRFEFKVEAGAEFVVTGPVFDVSAFERVLPRLQATHLPIVAGVVLFENQRHAEFMANEVPGIHVPEPLLERMRRADGAEAQAAEGVAIAQDLARALRPTLQGLQISAGSRGLDGVLEVIDEVR
jgi:homocysteine S-methyltransferase